MKLRFFFLAILLLPVAFAQTYEELKGGLLPQRACFDVYYYDLHLQIIPEKQFTQGSNTIFFKILSESEEIQLDLFENMHIREVMFENQPIRFERKFDAFFVKFPRKLRKDSLYNVKVVYHGKPVSSRSVRKDNGFFWLKHNEKDLVAVQCQISGASLWIPCKEHLADEPDSVRLHWEVPIELECISNGKWEKTEVSQKQGYKISHWFVQNPINLYNITFYLGDYRKRIGYYINEKSEKKPVEFYFLSYPAQDSTIKNFFINNALHFLAFCEKTFGEYAFWNDKFAVVESPYAGMEHQSCLAVRSMNKDYWRFSKYGLPYVLIHEMAHEWWGNAVSASDMGDMWLHEGFATYSQYLFIEYLYGKKAYTSAVNSLLYDTTKPILEKRGVYVADKVFGELIIYDGGAYFLHKLRLAISDDKVFYDILRTFYERFKKKNVLTEDFLAVVNEKTKKNWKDFFEKNLGRKLGN
ncbi:M1 family metallopeptidase [Raineya sp.]